MKNFLLAALLFFCAIVGQAQKIAGTWTGLLDAGIMKIHVVFHFQKDAAGKDICLMDSPDQSAKGIPATLNFISADSVSVSVPMIGASYVGKLKDQIIKGTFSQMGRNLPLDLKMGEVVQKRPQHPVPPYPYTTEEVSFTNEAAHVTLSGTLSYPLDYQKGQQVPVILMVSGSGPENRDSEIFGHKPFLVIADYLARHGIATLRYDDRAVGKSTGTAVTPTTKEVAEDAKAGIEYLRAQKAFSKVGLLGHSEGGSVAFMLASEQLLDFAISMAGIGAKGEEVLYAQAKKIVELSGQKYPMSQEQYKNMVLAQGNPWMNYFMAYDPVPDIQKAKCPVFALNGSKDVQVLAEHNLTAIEQHLPKNDQTKVKLYPGLNHLFQNCTTGLPTEYNGIEETISPEVLKDISDWIQKLQ